MPGGIQPATDRAAFANDMQLPATLSRRAEKPFSSAQPFAHKPHLSPVSTGEIEVSPLSLSIYSTINSARSGMALASHRRFNGLM
jgi:hypothetical protein